MNTYLPIALPLSPIIYRRLMSTIPASRFDEVLVEGRFTPREVIAHIADWEPILLDRIKAAVETPGASVQGQDEGQMAIDHNYKSTNVDEQLRNFERARMTTASYLKSLSDADRAKHVIHSERGPITVAEMASSLIGHDIYHFEQLSAYLEEKSAGTW